MCKKTCTNLIFHNDEYANEYKCIIPKSVITSSLYLDHYCNSFCRFGEFDSLIMTAFL